MLFVLGLLIGAGIASLYTLAQKEDAPSEVKELRKVSENIVAKVKTQTRDAIDAGEQAAADKEAEMRREYEESIHRKP